MPLQIRTNRITDDRKPVISKGEVVDNGRQRRGLREISNIPSQVTKKIADLKISTNVSHKPENKKVIRVGANSISQKDAGKRIATEKNVKPVLKREIGVSVLKNDVSTSIKSKNEAPVIINEIEDIDKRHEGNIYLVGEYAKDVYFYLMHLENKFKIHKWPPINSNITEGMRSILVDWLIDVHVEFHLLQETIHTAISILDRYIHIDKSLEKDIFQLVGVCSLSLACKYEEMFAPLMDDFVFLCKNAFQRKELIEMEKKILKSLNFDLGRPVTVVFLRRYNMAAKADKFQHCLSKYLIDLTLLDVKFIHIRPSLVAAAAAFTAMCIVQRSYDESFWTTTMVHYSSYNVSDLKPVAVLLAKTILSSQKSKHDSVKRKYAVSNFLGVSMKIISFFDIIRKIAGSDNSLAAPL